MGPAARGGSSLPHAFRCPLSFGKDTEPPWSLLRDTCSDRFRGPVRNQRARCPRQVCSARAFNEKNLSEVVTSSRSVLNSENRSPWPLGEAISYVSTSSVFPSFRRLARPVSAHSWPPFLSAKVLALTLFPRQRPSGNGRPARDCAAKGRGPDGLAECDCRRGRPSAGGLCAFGPHPPDCNFLSGDSKERRAWELSGERRHSKETGPLFLAKCRRPGRSPMPLSRGVGVEDRMGLWTLPGIVTTSSQDEGI